MIDCGANAPLSPLYPLQGDLQSFWQSAYASVRDCIFASPFLLCFSLLFSLSLVFFLYKKSSFSCVSCDRVFIIAFPSWISLFRNFRKLFHNFLLWFAWMNPHLLCCMWCYTPLEDCSWFYSGGYSSDLESLATRFQWYYSVWQFHSNPPVVLS